MDKSNLRLNPDIDVTDITLEYDATKLKVGNKVLVKAYTTPTSGSVTFQSMDSSIVAILPDLNNDFEEYGSCYLDCKQEGTVNIVTTSVCCCNFRKTFSLTIQSAEGGSGSGEDEDKESITLNVNDIFLCVGERFTIQPILKPENLIVNWKSNNPNICPVWNGLIEGRSKGEALITCYSENTSAYCKVTVADIAFNTTDYTIGIGQRITITPEIYPYNYPINWISSDSCIASADFKGIITGVSVGKVQVQAIINTQTGSIAKIFWITVVPKFTPVTEFTDAILQNLELYQSDEELRVSNAKVDIIIQPEGEKVPKLYYINTNKNPYWYDYKLAAVESDIQRFLLKQHK